MTKMWVLFVFFAVLLGPSCAFSEFTPIEKANIHNLVLNINLIRSGMQDLDMAQSYGGYYTAWQAAVDCHTAFGYLLGTQILQGEQSRATLAARPRSEWLGLAWHYLDRCISGADTAQTEAGYLTTKFGQAKTQLQQFPRGTSGGPVMLYLDPKPASYPNVVGPHGNYDFAQEYLWFAAKYAQDVTYIWGSRYMQDVANYETIAAASLANIRFTAAETGGFDTVNVDNFTNILWLQKFLLRDTAQKYHATQENEFMHPKLTDSWKNMDDAVEDTLCFTGRVACNTVPH